MRYEYKYIVPQKYYLPLKKEILPYVKLDQYITNNVTDDYTVRSIYFDNSRFNYYFEKIEGIKNRKKLRIRGYNNANGNSIVFFEIKRKFDIPIRKNRIGYAYENMLNIFQETDLEKFRAMKNGHHPNYEDIYRFFYHIKRYNLMPVVLIVYEREAYQDKFKTQNRVTFDKNLRSLGFPKIEDLFKNEDLNFVLSNQFILEVKFNDHFPVWLEPILFRYNLKKQSASKYTMGIDASGINTRSVASFFRANDFNHLKHSKSC